MLTAHVAASESRDAHRYQRSIDCQQPQQRHRAETTATYPEDVREWFQVERHCGNTDSEPSRYTAIDPTRPRQGRKSKPRSSRLRSGDFTSTTCIMTTTGFLSASKVPAITEGAYRDFYHRALADVLLSRQPLTLP